MVFTTDRFFEVTIDSWPEWDLDPWPLNSVQTLWPTDALTHTYMYISMSNMSLMSHMSFKKIDINITHHTHIYTYTYVYMCVYIYIYIYLYICMYVYNIWYIIYDIIYNIYNV